MTIDTLFLWTAFLGLFAIVNPFSAAIIFLTISPNDSHHKRLQMAKKASVVCALVLLIFIFTGPAVLNIFGITIEAFKIAGGIVIGRMGMNMLGARPKHTPEEEEEAIIKSDVSIVPLAIPLLSGPGAISTILVFTSRVPGPIELVGLAAIACIISALAYVIISHAELLKKLLGKTGINVIGRLMGLIVLVMGVQFMIDGLRMFLPELL